jgi:PAS domain S-box-containing protein
MMGTNEKSVLQRQTLSKHYEYMCRFANDVILLMDSDFRIIECNEKAIETYGYELDELIGMHVTDLRSLEARLDFEKTVKKFVERDGGHIYESEHRRKDGSTFSVEVSARSIKTKNEIFYQVVVRDVTERKETDNALKQSESLYRAIFDNTGTAMALMGDDTMIYMVNAEFEQQTGYCKEELVGKKRAMELVAKSDFERVNKIYELRMRDPVAAPRQYEFKIVTKQGKIRDLYMTRVVIPGTDRSIASIQDAVVWVVWTGNRAL